MFELTAKHPNAFEGEESTLKLAIEQKIKSLLANPKLFLQALPAELIYQNLQGADHLIARKTREEIMGIIWSLASENQRRSMMIVSGINPIFIGKNKEYDPTSDWGTNLAIRGAFVGCPAKTFITNHCLRLFIVTNEEGQSELHLSTINNNQSIDWKAFWNYFDVRGRKALLRVSRFHPKKSKKIPDFIASEWDHLLPNQQEEIRERIGSILL